jgi:hypothetical protein
LSRGQNEKNQSLEKQTIDRKEVVMVENGERQRMGGIGVEE